MSSIHLFICLLSMSVEDEESQKWKERANKSESAAKINNMKTIFNFPAQRQCAHLRASKDISNKQIEVLTWLDQPRNFLEN